MSALIELLHDRSRLTQRVKWPSRATELSHC